MSWWPALLGWPAIALSAGLAVAGFRRRNEYLLLGAIIPVLPMGFYLPGSPRLWWLPCAVLLVLTGLCWTVRRRRRGGEDGRDQ